MASEIYLTEYERERQKKIEENKRLLETLGIFETRSVLDASTLSLDTVKPKRNYIKRARVQLEPRRSERVSIRPQSTSYAESDDSGTESDKPKPKSGIRKLNSSYFSVRKTMWKPFYGQEIATCHICLVRNRQPKTKCSRCYADFWRGHVCRGCYESNFTGEDIESFDEARENPNWVCFVCRGICTCKFCRVGSTKRGKRYTKKRPLEEEEALALAQGQALQIKEERDLEEQGFLPRKRGRGRPPKSRTDLNSQALLLGSDPGDEDDQFDHPLFEGELDHYHQLDQLEQLEQLQEQLNQLEQLDQLEQLERQEREQERLRQEQLAITTDSSQELSYAHLHTHSHSQSLPPPLKRGRGRPPKNPQQQQFKRQKYQKHEIHHKHQLQKHRQSRHKSQEYSDIPDQVHKDIQVKQEPLLDDSLMGHDPSLLHDQMLQDHMLHDHMLMLPEQPILDIPPLQEHPLHLSMMHNQSLQDIPQEHSIPDQMFREHNTFQQTYHNNAFVHHSHHSSHHNSHAPGSNSMGLTSTTYNSHDPFSHSNHFGTNHHNGHHAPNSILSATTPSLLLDAPIYQHPYLFQHYYTYPQNQDLQHDIHDMQQHQHQQQQQELRQLQLQHQQQQQQQQHLMQEQEELQRQELHRQEMQRQEIQRQEMQRQELQRQEDDLHLRQHSLSSHHPILHYIQDPEPEVPSHRQDPHRDLLHPSLQDPQPSQTDDYYQNDNQDHFQSAYESRDHHENDTHHLINDNGAGYHDQHDHSLLLDHQFKQELSHPDLQLRELDHHNQH